MRQHHALDRIETPDRPVAGDCIPPPSSALEDELLVADAALGWSLVAQAAESQPTRRREPGEPGDAVWNAGWRVRVDGFAAGQQRVVRGHLVRRCSAIDLDRWRRLRLPQSSSQRRACQQP